MSKMLDRSKMHEVSLADLYQMARDDYHVIWGDAKAYGRDPKIYCHWTAGRYSQFWDAYHVQIDYDGKIYMPDGVRLGDILSGTYRRNSGAISITILGCFDATTHNGLGTNPPTAKQLESMYRVVTVLADALDLTIDIYHVLTHAECADNEDGIYPHENYGPKSTVERWDLAYLGTVDSPKYALYPDPASGGEIIRGHANWYREHYDVAKTHLQNFE